MDANQRRAASNEQKSTLIWTGAFALLLNGVWEVAQCPIFYDMSGLGWVKGSLRITSAIGGDVLIVLGLVYLTRVVRGRWFLSAPDARGWAVLLALSFVASVALEWIARSQQRWEYSRLMPALEIAGVSVGLLPIGQITFLPALSLLLALQKQRRAAA